MKTSAFFRHQWLALGLIIAMLLVATESPMWILLFCVANLMARILIDLGILPAPPKWITNSVVILLAVEVVFQYRSIFNQEAAVTLLLGITAVKILDYSVERDFKLLFQLGLLLLSLKPLFSLNFYWLFPSALAFFSLWMGILSDSDSHKIKRILKIFAFSVPLTICLFVIFPRIIVPWAKSLEDSRSVIGFEDNMNPGDIESLVENAGVAFRVKFSDRSKASGQISSDKLYWRGAVLLKSEGLRWRPVALAEKKISSPPQPEDLDYEVLQEPDHQRYLFTLDQVVSLQASKGSTESVEKLEFGVYRSPLAHTKVTSYRAQSNLSGVNTKDEIGDSPLFLQTPVMSQDILDLVQKLKQSGEQEKILQAIDHFFSDRSFQYTLHPGVYSSKDIDEFIFLRKKGFCEHFAAAYATLARASGIPARVIAGFQGGSYNPVGDFWEISTADAHAWVEVKMNDHWLRKDPTALVAPGRLTMGAKNFFDLSEEERNSVFTEALDQHRHSFLKNLYNQSLAVMSNFNYQWTIFFLEFDNQNAKNWIWTHLGQLASATLLLLSTALLTLLLRSRLNLRRNKSPLSKEILQSLGVFLGNKKVPSDTPLFILAQLGKSVAAQSSPELLIFLEQMAKTYEQEIYQELPLQKAQAEALRQAWKKWRRGIKRIIDLDQNFPFPLKK